MIPTVWQSRRLVPRWRSLSTTIDSKELALPRRSREVPAGRLNSDFLSKLERWRLSPELVTAAELVESAIIDGREADAVAAARRLVTIDENAAPLIRRQAAALLVRTGNKDDAPAELVVRPDHLSEPRYFTRLHPRDPLAWVELALHQTIHGHPVAAARSMSVALSLAPDNRHVLRSAARLFLHIDQPDRAHDLIARNDATKQDPWLIASEIALAGVAERTPRFFKVGQRFLDEESFNPRQISELAGAVATEELFGGNRRKARKDFGRSLVDPTGSALAQGEWASPTLGPDLVSVRALRSTPEPSEAFAYHLYRTGHFRFVPDICLRWANSDPFSIRPFEFGTATAGLIEEYEKAAQLALRGLELRPNAPTLLNGAAFALASLGKLAEATELLDRISATEEERARHIASANRGLIAFRLGDSDKAKSLYREAAAGFSRLGMAELSARAQVYLAREALLAGSDEASEMLNAAREAMKPYKKTETNVVLRRVEALFEGKFATLKDRKDNESGKHAKADAATSRSLTTGKLALAHNRPEN